LFELALPLGFAPGALGMKERKKRLGQTIIPPSQERMNLHLTPEFLPAAWEGQQLPVHELVGGIIQIEEHPSSTR